MIDRKQNNLKQKESSSMLVPKPANKLGFSQLSIPATRFTPPAQTDGRQIKSALYTQNPLDPNQTLRLVEVVETRLAALQIYSNQTKLDDTCIETAVLEENFTIWGDLPDQSQVKGFFGFSHLTDLFEDLAPGEQTILIKITWPTHSRAAMLDRLRAIAKAGGRQKKYWPVLVFSLMAVDFAFQGKNGSQDPQGLVNLPAMFSRLMQTRYKGGEKELDLTAIEKLAARQKYQPDMQMQTDIPGGLDCAGLAFFWLQFGKMLWHSETRRNYARQASLFDKNPKFYFFLGVLADHCLQMQYIEQAEITAGGARLQISMPDTKSRLNLWHQMMEFERWAAPLDTIRKILSIQLSGEPYQGFTLAEGFDLPYAAALTAQLISDAKKNQVFAPQGAFTIQTPANLPLKGLTGLYIQATPKGMWVLPQPVGQAIFWQPDPDNMASGWEIDQSLAAAFHLVLAAIWHDLVTRGPEVMVHLADRTDAPNIVVRLSRRLRGRSGRSLPRWSCHPPKLYIWTVFTSGGRRRNWKRSGARRTRCAATSGG